MSDVVAPPAGGDLVLDVADLEVRFGTGPSAVGAVRGVSIGVGRREVVGLVGESGCGKSTTALAIAQLLPSSATVRASRMIVDGVVAVSSGTAVPGAAASIRGRRLGMVFQDPTASLNPTMTVGRQVAEPLRLHSGLSRRAAAERAVELLEQVGIPEPARRAAAYPHQLSGGQRQRIGIAMAIACDPPIVVADEATTALDVTVQAEILDLLRSLRERLGMSFVFVSHDLGVMGEFADRVVVMYAGRVVEEGPVRDVLRRPRHPYTAGLLACVPTLSSTRSTIAPIPGQPPLLTRPVVGCAFRDRCPRAVDRCAVDDPALAGDGDHRVACWNPIADIIQVVGA